jgi:hypothetical protein
MLVIPVAESFCIGGTAPITVNGRPTTLTWLAEDRVRIGDKDERNVVIRMDGGDNGLVTFYCGAASEHNAKAEA